mmetsp:Transcript_16479/g.40824  ORF Transcript_16479/g.40824 Transcript_16479/m.40824 type:complete len:225 (-) Transcript_16479:668-1342(-)
MMCVLTRRHSSAALYLRRYCAACGGASLMAAKPGSADAPGDKPASTGAWAGVRAGVRSGAIGDANGLSCSGFPSPGLSSSDLSGGSVICEASSAPPRLTSRLRALAMRASIISERSSLASIWRSSLRAARFAWAASCIPSYSVTRALRICSRSSLASSQSPSRHLARARRKSDLVSAGSSSSTLSQDSMQMVKSRVLSAAACALRRTCTCTSSSIFWSCALVAL